MERKTEQELERARVAKVARALVRLKHSLAADEELNSLLPDTLEAFDRSLAQGELKHIGRVIDDVLET
jgi:hypothetical protein